MADAPLQELDDHQLAAVFAVKAQAASQLLQTLRNHDGRYLILYSSAAATLGAPGQSAHALACGYLDGLAQQFSTLDAPKTLSVAWGAWGESGRAATPEMLATLASRGMGALSDAEGCWHLEQAVMRGAPWRLAMRVFTDKMPPLQQALFNISATEKAATPVIPPADDNAFNGSLSDETAVMAWLKKRIAVQLRLSDPASLHPNQDLLQLGMDSLLFLELSSDIQHYLVYASMRNGRGRICLLMDSRSLSVLSQRRRLPLRSRKCCGTTPTSVMRPSFDAHSARLLAGANPPHWLWRRRLSRPV